MGSKVAENPRHRDRSTIRQCRSHLTNFTRTLYRRRTPKGECRCRDSPRGRSSLLNPMALGSFHSRRPRYPNRPDAAKAVFRAIPVRQLATEKSGGTIMGRSEEHTSEL